MRPKSSMGLLAAWIAAVGACSGGARQTASTAPAASAVKPESEIERANAAVARYLDATLAANPGMGRALGLHAYDGRVARVSRAAIEAEVARARAYLEETRAFELAALPDPPRLDLELTRLHAERTLFHLTDLKSGERILSYTSLFDVSSYLLREYAPLEVRTRAMLDHVEAATAEVDAVLGLLAKAQPRTHLETAEQMLSGLRAYYETDVDVATAPARARDPELAARYTRVVARGLAAVDRLLEWIGKTGRPHATEDFALGTERFLRMLEVNEGLKITLPELQAMAEADHRRNYDAFVAAAKKIDPKLSTRAVAEKVAAERLERDAVLPAAEKQLEDLLAFIQKNDIVTIGSEDRATVAVTPPFMRWNSAFLDMAGPFETVKGSFYYISPPNPAWPKEMQDAYIPYFGDLLWTSVHEVYPGHFVQGLQVRRAPTLAGKMLDSYAFVEGWAHYAEEMMFEAGYGRSDPRIELGQLSNALLRNCRFLAAIGLHTQGMTVATADEMFRERCFIDPGNATQQAYRGTFDPGYLSYTLGKLQIKELRSAFFARRDTRSLRVFHDWLLSFGSAPVALIERRL